MGEEFFWILTTGILSMGIFVLLSLPNKVSQETIFLAFISGMLIRTLFCIFENICNLKCNRSKK